MRLKTRVSSTVIGSYVVLIGVLYLIFSFVLDKDYRVIERVQMQDHLTRLRRGLDAPIQRILMPNTDWAKWDDTYNFMESKDIQYFESNVTYDYVASLHIDHLLFLDSAGKTTAGFSVDSESETLVPIRPEIESAVVAPSIWASPNEETPVTGFTRIGDAYFIAVSVAIQDSNLSKKSRGALIFLEAVGDDFIKSLSERINLPVSGFFVNGDPLPNDIASHFESLREKQSGGSVVYVKDDTNISGAILLRDRDGSPMMVLQITQPRSVYLQGLDTRNWVLIFLVIAGIVSALVTITLLEFTVVNRFKSLSGQLQHVALSGDPTLRMAVKGRDEIKSISNDVNAMLAALESSEQQLRIARDAAQAANLAKSTFVAKVSHELRTPIHSIVGMLRILFKEERSTAKRDYIKMARDAAYSLLGTINDILDFSKIESGNLTLETVPLNLRELIRETLRTVGPRAEEKEGLELVGYIDPAIPDALLGDPLRVKQSIINLLSNAVKFTAAGSVSVDVALVKVSPTSTEITISVRDTGVGIPEHRLQKIFDPFTQADESVARVFQGTGLGLTIVKQLVEAMGGSVSVSSRIGLGTDFVLHIPFTRPQPALEWDLPKPKSSGKAIVVDNQTAASELWRKFFKIQGFSTTWINTKDDASINRIAQIASDSEFMVFTEEALQRSAVFNFVVETAGQPRHCPMVAVLSPFAISLREKLLSLSVKNVLVRPCLPDDILLSLAGRLEVGDHVWDGDVDFVSEVSATLNILIADDTYTNRFILQSMLEEGGHTVTAVTNGQELYDLLAASITDPAAKKYDIVFTDVQMPIMDGITATQKIRTLETGLANVHTRIVAVTAHAMTEEKTRMRDCGVDEVITKPVEPSEVARVLVKVSEEIVQTGGSMPTAPKAATPIRQTKIVLGNELDLQAVATRVWTQFLESGGDLGDLVQTAVDGKEIRTDQEGLQSFLNVQETFERSGGSVRRTMMIFRAFLSSFKDILAHVAHAKSERNAEELRKASHSLKGILLEVGAKNPGTVAGNVEQLCNAGKLEEALKLINPVTHQTLAAARILEKIVEAVEVEQKQVELSASGPKQSV